MLVLLDGSDVKSTLARITGDVFSMMVDMNLELREDAPELKEPVTAMLSFRQPVGKVLLLECDRELAFHLAQRMMSLDETPMAVNENVRDSVAEMVNMIGGNFRTLFTERESLDTTPCLLSLSAMRLVERETPLATIWLGGSNGNIKLSLKADSLSGLSLLIDTQSAARPIAIDSLQKEIYLGDLRESTAA